MPYFRGSYPNDIIMWYQYVTIHSETHEIYLHPYYCFRPKSNDSKVFSAVNEKNTTKHYLLVKYSTKLSEWGNKIYTTLIHKQNILQGL